eukprot:COSAG02_NODE_6793_length_3358_cov_16.504449_2_plen_127_part_00
MSRHDRESKAPDASNRPRIARSPTASTHGASLERVRLVVLPLYHPSGVPPTDVHWYYYTATSSIDSMYYYSCTTRVVLVLVVVQYYSQYYSNTSSSTSTFVPVQEKLLCFVMIASVLLVLVPVPVL